MSQHNILTPSIPQTLTGIRNKLNETDTDLAVAITDLDSVMLMASSTHTELDLLREKIVGIRDRLNLAIRQYGILDTQTIALWTHAIELLTRFSILRSAGLQIPNVLFLPGGSGAGQAAIPAAANNHVAIPALDTNDNATPAPNASNVAITAPNTSQATPPVSNVTQGVLPAPNTGNNDLPASSESDNDRDHELPTLSDNELDVGDAEERDTVDSEGQNVTVHDAHEVTTEEEDEHATDGGRGTSIDALRGSSVDALADDERDVSLHGIGFTHGRKRVFKDADPAGPSKKYKTAPLTRTRQARQRRLAGMPKSVKEARGLLPKNPNSGNDLAEGSNVIQEDTLEYP
ncbi:hypothetical protein BDN72DRAFT_864019 [Pluteus cervinus]|uniref:Uncharacterized protein n=1 Tax=Pluteus cervinus TaxID=181527 RepID=A0ACD3A5C3_9AGAR|nr:hypothetical protein BDN72DRAFT_864019 [Pluteus cervinus]